MLSNCHLWYPNTCNCLHDSDNEDGDKMFKFSPLLDVDNIAWFVNIPRKWTDWVHKTDCTCKYDELMTYIEHFNVNNADKKKIIYCMAEDVLCHHGYEPLCRQCTKCFCTK